MEQEDKKRSFDRIIGHRFERNDDTTPSTWNYEFLAVFKEELSDVMPDRSFAKHMKACQRRQRANKTKWMECLPDLTLFQMANKSDDSDEKNKEKKVIGDDDEDEYDVLYVKSLPGKGKKEATVKWAPVWVQAADSEKYMPTLVKTYIHKVGPSMVRFDGDDDDGKQLTIPHETEYGVIDPDGTELLVASVSKKDIELIATAHEHPIDPRPPVCIVREKSSKRASYY